MQATNNGRDFSSISSSAKWILLMKGHTNIPYAKEAAALVEAPRPFVPNLQSADRSFWGRTLHFESRYYSIDALLHGQAVSNVLELSSGFSFRGLDLV